MSVILVWGWGGLIEVCVINMMCVNLIIFKKKLLMIFVLGSWMEIESYELLSGRVAGDGQFERRRRRHVYDDAGPEDVGVVTCFDTFTCQDEL